MSLRKKLKYPPYYYLLSLRICSRDYEKCNKEALKIVTYLKSKLKEDYIILGPTMASMFKLKNIFRLQILIKYKKDEILKKELKYIDELYLNNKEVYLEIDNNPLRV